MNIRNYAQAAAHWAYNMIGCEYSQAKRLQSGVLEIQRLAEYEFPNLESDYGRGGFLITIDGVQGIMIGKGNLTVGDYVIMEYLPQSKYILSIMEVPKE